jgi:hypothetical protein
MARIAQIVASLAVEAALDQGAARVLARIAEHAEPCDETEEQYVTGLRDALALMLGDHLDVHVQTERDRDEIENSYRVPYDTYAESTEPPMRKSNSGAVDHP